MSSESSRFHWKTRDVQRKQSFPLENTRCPVKAVVSTGKHTMSSESSRFHWKTHDVQRKRTFPLESLGNRLMSAPTGMTYLSTFTAARNYIWLHVGCANSFFVCASFVDINGGQKSVAHPT